MMRGPVLHTGANRGQNDHLIRLQFLDNLIRNCLTILPPVIRCLLLSSIYVRGVKPYRWRTARTTPERTPPMDSKQFDELVARLASTASRRNAVKGVLGGTLASVGVTSVVSAKKQGKASAKK